MLRQLEFYRPSRLPLPNRCTVDRIAIRLANAGGDTINSIKQASEFGIVQGGQKLAGLLIFITDIHALGLKTAQGLIFTDPWYWDQNDANRAFAKEYFAAHGRMPSYTVVGVYSAVFHYLRAVEALGSHADGKAMVAKMKELPTEDKLMGKGSVRIDGRKIDPMYLFEVKKPEESKGPWDHHQQLATIPAEEAWRPRNMPGTGSGLAYFCATRHVAGDARYWHE